MFTGCQLKYNKFKIWKLLFHILLKGSQNILSLTGYDLTQITTGCNVKKFDLECKFKV